MSPVEMFQFVIMFILLLYRRLKQLVKMVYDHLKQFYLFDLDLIQNCVSLRQMEQLMTKYRPRAYSLFPWFKLRIHFVPPCVAFLYLHLDNLYYTFVVYDGYNATGIPELFVHRINPQYFWDLMDILIPTANTQGLFYYLYLALVRRNIEPENVMFAVWNEKIGKRTIYCKGKFWKQSKSDQILKFRSRLRRFYSLVMASSVLLMYAFYLTVHFMKGNLLTMRNMWITVIINFWIAYLSYGDISVAYNFHIAAKCIQFKQRCKIRKINVLMDKMASAVDRTWQSPSRQRPNFCLLRWTIWSKFYTCQHKINALSRELTEHNRFWSFLLTDYVLGYVVYVSYLSYGMLQGSVDSLLKKSIFIFFSIHCACSILLVTSVCSAIVRNNVAIYKANQRFAYLYSSTFPASKLQLLKLSKIIANFKGTRAGFRFITGGIIDSKMFEILFYSMTVLYMKIFNKKVLGIDFVG